MHFHYHFPFLHMKRRDIKKVSFSLFILEMFVRMKVFVHAGKTANAAQHVIKFNSVVILACYYCSFCHSKDFISYGIICWKH